MIIIQQFFNIAKMAIVKAADWPRSRYKVQRILSINRVVGNLDLSESFYCEGLGFQPVKRRAVDKSLLAALGVGEGQETVLQLGNDLLTLVEFAHPGRPYPCPRLSNDPWFQHIAIIVADMDEAYARLSRRSDWTPVSQGGPQTLPPENGQVRAFQFRDPDGHPIEFLWFPPGYKPALCQGHAASSTYLDIDHSALSVRSKSMSLRFYSALGFSLVAHTLNQGPPQDHLVAFVS